MTSLAVKPKPAPLVGLTVKETRELHSLANAVRTKDEFEAIAQDARWIELSLKHEMAKLAAERAQRRKSSPPGRSPRRPDVTRH
jgi:hypothetical protein